MAYATYLGGKTATGVDVVAGIAADAEGYAYVSGRTSSADFPVTKGAYQTSIGTNSGDAAAFVAKLNPVGTAIEWATYLGGIEANTSRWNRSVPFNSMRPAMSTSPDKPNSVSLW